MQSSPTSRPRQEHRGSHSENDCSLTQIDQTAFHRDSPKCSVECYNVLEESVLKPASLICPRDILDPYLIVYLISEWWIICLILHLLCLPHVVVRLLTAKLPAQPPRRMLRKWQILHRPEKSSQ